MTYSNWIRASRRTASFGVAALLAVGLAACGDGPTTGETTTLSLQLTDHPSGDVEAAWLQVDSVEFQGTGGGVVVMDEPTDFIEVSDLQAEEGEFESLVEGVEVPSGTYGQVRVFIGGAAIQSSAGDVFTLGEVPSGITDLDPDGTEELACPSCDPTGIKAILPEGAVQLDGLQKVLAIDFDVSQSFGHEAGGSGTWILHPVMEILDLEITGRIEGTIAFAEGSSATFPECGGGEDPTTSVVDFEPLAVNTADEEHVASGTVNPDGSYAILAAPATYEMTYADTVEFGNGDLLIFDASPVGDPVVELAEGAVVTVDYELNEVTCETDTQ